jgi:anti-anti-sigma factor
MTTGTAKRELASEPRYRPLLSVTSTPYGTGIVVVRLAGELDRANVSSAAAAIEEALAHEDSMLVLDLQDLEFLDASGIALLADLDHREGYSARLRILPSRSLGVTRTLSRVGLAAMVKVVRG